MIRFKQLRPRYIPSWLGISSENAAHRIAVEWEQDGETKEGVFILRRDTNSWFNETFGGKVFPGIFQRSAFSSQETAEVVSIQIIKIDGQEQIGFSGYVTTQIPDSSIFPSLDEAAQFFSLGAIGYSATYTAGHYHGMLLHSLNWSIKPLAINYARSNFYDDQSIFPEGSRELDGALIMRNIPHQWHSRPDLYLAKDQSTLTRLQTR